MSAAASILTLQNASGEPTLDDILAAVSAEFRLPVDYITGPMRWPKYCRARHVFCYVARTVAQQKWISIAATIKRDHCTAHNSMTRVEADPRKFEPELSRVIARLYQVRKAA